MSRGRRRGPKIVARNKEQFKHKDAIRSLEAAGFPPWQFRRACHTGTYWRWELK